MKRVLLTTTAIVGLSAPAFAADPTAVSDQPYFHHSHPMTWSGAMSISLTNPSGSDVDTAIVKAGKRDFLFSFLNGDSAGGEEDAVGDITNGVTGAAAHIAASDQLSHMASMISTHASYTIGATDTAVAANAGNASAVEDVIDDFLGGSHSEAMDVLAEAVGNTGTNGSDASDLNDDLVAFQA